MACITYSFIAGFATALLAAIGSYLLGSTLAFLIPLRKQ